MIDTHAHLHLIHRDLTDILDSARQANVTHIIQVAIDEASIQTNLSLYNRYDQISITGGIHPLSVSKDFNQADIISTIERTIDSFVAIGETGLDYKYGVDSKELQLDWFHAQLDLAQRHAKPVVIHSRHADDDMLAVVNQYPNVRKVFHCYATNVDFFNALNGNQNYVSFTGMITFSKKGKLANAVRNIPLDRIMIETDSPYLIPKGVSTEQNAPEYVGFVASHIAFLKQCPATEVISKTTDNAVSFFNL